jgi:tetratricopeptide (TPR) repeat protein
MRTIIILCSLLALVAGCSGAKTAPAQAPPPATQGGQGLDRPRGGDAIAAYREAIRRSPNDAELHYHLGVAYAKEGRLEQAIASYRQAIALEPQYAEAYEGLGLAYDRSGQAEKAAAAAREAGRLKAEYAELHYHLGLAYAKEGRLEQAMATYRKALALKPDHPGAREGLLALTGAAGHEPGASPARQERAPGLPEGATETAPAESVTPPGHHSRGASTRGVWCPRSGAGRVFLHSIRSHAPRGARRAAGSAEPHASTLTPRANPISPGEPAVRGA